MPKRIATTEEGKDILARIRRIGPFLMGTLAIVKKRCGSPRCRCQTEGRIHEAALLTWKDENQKTRTLSVPRRMRDEVREWVEEGKRLRELMRQMSEEQRKFLISRRETTKTS